MNNNFDPKEGQEEVKQDGGAEAQPAEQAEQPAESAKEEGTEG